MALDVFLVWPGDGAENGQLVTQLEWHTPDYHFLSQFWPPTSSVGKPISAFEDVLFSGANLAQLRGSLERATAAIQGKPEVWVETVGSRSQRRNLPVTLKLRRKKLESMIAVLSEAVREAEASGRALLFSGD
jgi:hypothetical protein